MESVQKLNIFLLLVGSRRFYGTAKAQLIVWYTQYAKFSDKYRAIGQHLEETQFPAQLVQQSFLGWLCMNLAANFSHFYQGRSGPISLFKIVSQTKDITSLQEKINKWAKKLATW